MAIILFYCNLMAAEIRVGIGRKVITPVLQPVWMGGYASRDKPASGIIHDLWAKALVFEETPESRVVIVTSDAHKLSRAISESVANRINKKYGIKRSQLLLNASHTHSGPMIWPNADMFDFKPADQQAVFKYSQQLTDDLVAVIEMAMNNLAPMDIRCGHGSSDFAVNRREPTDKGVIIGVNNDGPVDRDVPVIRISTPDGKLQAVLFGYACHNTTLGGDNYMINGDYAGFAQIELEKAHPGVTAMFFQGCGGDQNPEPRGTMELAEQHGKSIAGVVEKVLAGELRTVRPPVRTDYTVVDLELRPFDIGIYEKDIMSSNRALQRRAKVMLLAYNNGWDLSHFAYPVQAIRFNNDLTILALGGEVVVDYSLWAKKEYKNENIFVAGYCNEVICYIPTRRVLNDGGYEPNSSLINYLLPGPFADNVEDKVLSAIHQVMKKTGAKLSKK